MRKISGWLAISAAVVGGSLCSGCVNPALNMDAAQLTQISDEMLCGATYGYKNTSLTNAEVRRRGINCSEHTGYMPMGFAVLTGTVQGVQAAQTGRMPINPILPPTPSYTSPSDRPAITLTAAQAAADPNAPTVIWLNCRTQPRVVSNAFGENRSKVGGVAGYRYDPTTGEVFTFDGKNLRTLGWDTRASAAGFTAERPSRVGGGRLTDEIEYDARTGRYTSSINEVATLSTPNGRTGERFQTGPSEAFREGTCEAHSAAG